MSDVEYLEAEKDRLGCKRQSHNNAELRQRLNHAGAVTIGWQCLECGCWKAVKRSAVSAPGSLPPFDPGIATRMQEARRLLWEEEKTEKIRGWWERYDRYLKSERWKKKRVAVLARDGKVCRACLVREASQAHHLSYEHVGDEPLFDLVAVCSECHDRITEMDRVRRNTGRTPLDGSGP